MNNKSIIINGGSITFVQGIHSDTYPLNEIYIHMVSEETVSFMKLSTKDWSGYPILTSKIDELPINGEIYAYDDYVDGTVGSLITADAGLAYQVVQALPEKGSNGVIYLVKSETSAKDNVYTEYIWVEADGIFEIFGSVNTGEISLDGYYTSEQVDALLNGKVNTTDVYTKEEVDTKIDEVEALIPDVSEFITKSEVEETYQVKGDYTTKTYVDEADAALKAEYTAKIENKQDKLISGTNIKTINGNDLLGSGNLVMHIPTKVSELENDEDYATNSDVNEYVSNEIAQVNTTINTKANKSDVYTKSEVDAKVENVEVDLSNYYTKDETYDRATIDEKVAQGGTFDPTLYYNKTETDEKLALKADASALDNYATKTALQGVSDMATKSAQDIDAINETLVDKADKSVIPTKVSELENDADFATKSELPTVPTNISAFTNDAGYLTEHQSLDGYATEQWVEDKKYLTEHQDISGKLDKSVYDADKVTFETIVHAEATYQPKGDYVTNNELNTKQDTLVSGTNIKTINGNTILGEGNIDIEGGSGDMSNYYTKEEVDAKYATQTALTELQTQVGDIAEILDLINGEANVATLNALNDIIDNV